MRRGFWFAAGAASGVYVLTKARRTAEAFTPEGLRDRLTGLSLGAHLLREEVRAEMTEKETELRGRLKLDVSGPTHPVAALNPGSTIKTQRSS